MNAAPECPTRGARPGCPTRGARPGCGTRHRSTGGSRLLRGQDLVHACSAGGTNPFHRIAAIFHGGLYDGFHFPVFATTHAITFVHLGTSRPSPVKPVPAPELQDDRLILLGWNRRGGTIGDCRCALYHENPRGRCPAWGCSCPENRAQYNNPKAEVQRKRSWDKWCGLRAIRAQAAWLRRRSISTSFFLKTNTTIRPMTRVRLPR